MGRAKSLGLVVSFFFLYFFFSIFFSLFDRKPFFFLYFFFSVITVRRVGMDYATIRSTVLTTDLTMLPAEHAELLINYIPTDEEMTALQKHSHSKERLAEAERFMFEMLSVDRFESR